MIKVTGSNVTDSEVEVIVTACRFFLDRLLPTVQQKKLVLDINVTDRPGRTPIAIKWLVGSSGLFGWKPPRRFIMTVSVAAGVKDSLLLAANEIVHVAQTVSGRLKISIKNRKVNGKREEVYAASWTNGRYAFVDMTPRENRFWEIEAQQLKTQLVDEFLLWSAGKVKKLPTQKPKKSGYGLYNIRPQIIAGPVTISQLPAPAVDEVCRQIDTVDLLTSKPNLLADTSVADEPNDRQLVGDKLSSVSKDEPLSKASPETINLSSAQLGERQQAPDQRVSMKTLDIDNGEFKISVNVPRLGMDRLLDSAMLIVKLNDLLERGLIPHNVAREAFLRAQKNRITR
jgi:hypothetical protein